MHRGGLVEPVMKKLVEKVIIIEDVKLLLEKDINAKIGVETAHIKEIIR